MSHQIKLADFKGYKVSHQMVGAFGKGENKELRIVVVDGEIEYEVLEKNKLSLTTSSIESAIDRYNSI